MAEIIKTQLHPDGDKDTVLHPETSVEQVVDFNDKVDLAITSKVPSYWAHHIKIASTNSTFFIFCTIINRSGVNLRITDICEYLQKCENLSCSGVLYGPERIVVRLGPSTSDKYIIIGYIGGNELISSSECSVIDNPVKI